MSDQITSDQGEFYKAHKLPWPRDKLSSQKERFFLKGECFIFSKPHSLLLESAFCPHETSESGHCNRIVFKLLSKAACSHEPRWKNMQFQKCPYSCGHGLSGQGEFFKAHASPWQRDK